MFNGVRTETNLISSNEDPVKTLLDYLNKKSHALLVMGTAGKEKSVCF